MLAQLLHESGLFLGSADELLGPNESNQEGHFEHTGFLKINEALLRHFGGSWQDPPELKPGWERDPGPQELILDARALLQTFSGKSPWGWKDPRTTILLPFWKSLIPHLRFVICIRNPLDVANSLRTRDRLSLEHGVILWNRYLRAAIEETHGYPRLMAFYDDFFLEGGEALDRLVHFCGLQTPNDPSGIRSAIRGELRHHSSEMLHLMKDRSIPSECKLLYMGLRAISASEGPEAKGADHLLPLLDEFCDARLLSQLQRELTERKSELFTLRKQIYEDLKANHRWAYRLYRNFLKPFRVRQP